MTWRKWMWKMSHETVINAHRSERETSKIVERQGWWATLARDCADWYLQCVVCQQYRGTPMRPLTRSTAASDALSALLPWQDVIIDVTGPFTRAEGGERYVLACLCTKLRVPKLAVLKRLQHGFFSRALLDCVFRARRIADTVRCDRGPEMVNMTMKEIMAIMNIRPVTGASLTPRHQGKVERSHQV